MQAAGNLNIPNSVSVLRLLGVPVFLWLVLVARNDTAAFAVLMLAGVTDWLDGFLARRLGQQTRLGALLDPAADRLYIFSVAIALAVRDFVPWWFAAALVARDVMLWSLLPWLRRRGRRALPAHFLGKAATFNLLYAFPLLLLGGGDSTFSLLADVFGWAFAFWGLGLYLWSGLVYLWQTRQLLERTSAVSKAELIAKVHVVHEASLKVTGASLADGGSESR